MKQVEPGAEPSQVQPMPALGSPRTRLPFQSLGRKEWARLGLAALAVCYLVMTGYWLFYFGLFKYVAGDFRAFWSAADLAQHVGYAKVYDLTLLAEYQRPLFYLYPSYGPTPDYLTVPMPFLPVFVAAFTPLLPLGATAGFAAWTALNLVLIALYFVRLGFALRRAEGGRLSVLAMLLSWPVFLTLFFGQVNLILLVAAGEFTLALARRRSLMAGMWLGLFLIKPQMLILLLPGLLLARQRNALIGFVVTAVPILAGSAYLVGWDGLRDPATLLSQYIGGLLSNTAQHMMNWRALAENLGAFVPTEMKWAIVGIGTLVCAAAALWLWWLSPWRNERSLAAAILATFAATNVVSWHSHMQMAVPTIAVLAYAAAYAVVPGWLANLWMLAPGVVMMAALFTLGNPMAMAYSATLTFALNLALEAWAVIVFFRARRKGSPVLVAEPQAEPPPSAVSGPLEGQWPVPRPIRLSVSPAATLLGGEP